MRKKIAKDYSSLLSARILNFQKKKLPSERASQEVHNGANFSFIAPSREELWVHIEIASKL